MAVQDLRQDAMMSHLIDSLEAGKSIEHYGRLVFAMVARHFLDEWEVVAMLEKDPECQRGEAERLVRQVSAKDYNPPQRERIIEWMQKQDFPICPDSGDPKGCNVYRDLRFPDSVYDKISAYYDRNSGG